MFEPFRYLYILKRERNYFYLSDFNDQVQKKFSLYQKWQEELQSGWGLGGEPWCIVASLHYANPMMHHDSRPTPRPQISGFAQPNFSTYQEFALGK